jgi:hypothetical protein
MVSITSMLITSPCEHDRVGVALTGQFVHGLLLRATQFVLLTGPPFVVVGADALGPAFDERPSFRGALSLDSCEFG